MNRRHFLKLLMALPFLPKLLGELPAPVSTGMTFTYRGFAIKEALYPSILARKMQDHKHTLWAKWAGFEGPVIMSNPSEIEKLKSDPAWVEVDL